MTMLKEDVNGVVERAFKCTGNNRAMIASLKGRKNEIQKGGSDVSKLCWSRLRQIVRYFFANISNCFAAHRRLFSPRMGTIAKQPITVISDI